MNTEFITLIRRYSQILAVVNSHPHDYMYTFMDERQFCDTILRKNIKTANAIYVQELLFRSHIAAITTLFRNEKWMDGVNLACGGPNYYMLAAALRGLIECAADSLYCLVHVPGTLRDHYDSFYEALKGRFDAGLVTCEDFENILIHYSHGKKQPKGSVAPTSHFAKTSQEYLRTLDEPGRSDVRDLYAELCQVTHPAEQTVSIFIVAMKGSTNDYVVNKKLDMELIASLLHRHASAFPNIFQMSFNSALLSLYVLNRFDDNRFFTAGIEKLDLRNIAAFGSLKKAMEQSA